MTIAHRKAIDVTRAAAREAIAYHYLAGLPYQDVAAITGGSTDAARRAAADGIARLRKTYPGAALPDGENS